jgi:pimeloyl-ACP methyl ester carboxylesterase
MRPVDESGTGEPVVLLHAGIADRTMWRQTSERLAAAGFRAVAPDLPGFGEAPISPGPQAPWEDVLAMLRELGIDRAALVGDSFGAAVALRVAVLAPAAVRALVLVSPPPLDRDPSPRLAAAWEAEEAALARGDVEAAVTAVLDAWLQPGAPPELRDHVAAMQRRAFARQLAAGEPPEAPDPLHARPGALDALAVPLLTMAGEFDMPDFLAGARDLAARVHGGSCTTVPGAGHLAPLESPEAFLVELITFLRAAD